MSRAREARTPRSIGWQALLAGALFSAIGLGVGYLGPQGWDQLTSSSPSTPQARVGYALANSRLIASNRAWAKLEEDTRMVRKELDPRERSVFDFVVARAGLDTQGVRRAPHVEERCRSLGWLRCDHESLREFEKRSAP